MQKQIIPTIFILSIMAAASLGQTYEYSLKPAEGYTEADQTQFFDVIAQVSGLRRSTFDKNSIEKKNDQIGSTALAEKYSQNMFRFVDQLKIPRIRDELDAYVLSYETGCMYLVLDREKQVCRLQFKSSPFRNQLYVKKVSDGEPPVNPHAELLARLEAMIKELEAMHALLKK